VSDLGPLREIVELDRLLDRLAYQRDHGAEAAELAKVEHHLRELAGELKAVEATRAPLVAELNAVRAEIEGLRARRGSLEARLASSTGGAKELGALSHEIETLTATISTREDREIELVLLDEPYADRVAEIRRAAEPLVERRVELQAAVAAAVAAFDDELAVTREARATAAAPVEAALLQRYEHIKQRVGVSGAAFESDGRCDGCRMALSPLDRDRFHAVANDATFTCPECGRLLLPC